MGIVGAAAEASGWPEVMSQTLASAALLVAFVVSQVVQTSPMFDLGLLGKPALSTSAAALLDLLGAATPAEKGQVRTLDQLDFPPGTLSPSEHGPSDHGWKGTWRFEQIVGTSPIGVLLPERLNPGPLASKITFFAPVSLLFFFFVTGVLLAARQRSIHPMNYFLLACAFFAFHLLFAYLIDQIAVGPAFAAASAVSVFLVVTYARLFVGWRTALVQMGVAQVVYLVLFSFTFFWKGFTGLAITVGAIATLFVIMQLTGKLDWAEVLRRPSAPPAPPVQQPLPTRPV